MSKNTNEYKEHLEKYPELKKWVEVNVKKYPEKYGVDDGSSRIALDYLIKTNPELKDLNRLTIQALSHCATAYRFKNKFLKDNPQYDFRVKNKPKKRLVLRSKDRQ